MHVGKAGCALCQKSDVYAPNILCKHTCIDLICIMPSDYTPPPIFAEFWIYQQGLVCPVEVWSMLLDMFSVWLGESVWRGGDISWGNLITSPSNPALSSGLYLIPMQFSPHWLHRSQQLQKQAVGLQEAGGPSEGVGLTGGPDLPQNHRTVELEVTLRSI